MSKPQIPVGDVVRGFKLPKWLRKVLNALKGVVIHAGPVDILLDEDGQPISRGPRQGKRR